MTKKKPSEKSREIPTATALIEQALAKKKIGSWAPPKEFLPALIKVLEHNVREPKLRVGTRKIKEWLATNGIQIGVETLRHWMQSEERKLSNKA